MRCSKTIKICKKLILLSTVFSVFHSPADAEIHTADSLEWMTVDSALIVKGFIEDVIRTPSPTESAPNLAVEDVRIRVNETLKGNYSEETISVRRLSYSESHSTALDWKKSNAEYLFFLKVGEGELNGIDMDGHWTLRSDYPYGSVNLEDPSSSALYIVSASMGSPKTGDQILQIVQHTINDPNENVYTYRALPEFMSDWAVPNGAVLVEAPDNSEAYKTLWSGSSCFVVIPENMVKFE